MFFEHISWAKKNEIGQKVNGIFLNEIIHIFCLSVISDQGGNNMRGMRSSGMSSDDSDSPTHGYPDFPPSPDSWLGESVSRSNQAVNNQTSDC